MKYKIVLTGGKELVISEEQKTTVQQLWDQESYKIIDIDGELIKASSIRGIFKAYDVDNAIRTTNDVISQIDRDFNDECYLLARLTPKEKTDKEIETRILPGWKASGMSEDDPILADAYGTIINFFEENPQHPRCPAYVWWPIIRDKIKEKPVVSRWFEIVHRHDIAIEEWVKYQKKNR